MLESVRCPSCSTHYGLKASRMRAGLRRARCFRCTSVFGIEDAVQRLLQPVDGETAGIGPEDLLDLGPILEDSPALEAPAAAGTTEEQTPSLTLGDLEGTDDILEKTLITGPEGLSAEPPPAVPEDLFEATEGGYSSAKDAISKLLGNTPAPEHSPERRGLGRPSSQMDVEATLDALESTLGGAGSKELALTGPESAPLTASTMKLTHDEILSAMKAASLPLPTPAAPTAAVPRPPVPLPAREAAPEGDPSLLKVQVGQEVYNNVSMDQITSWIEQGRVQDFHMVARQFSENWIEAGKVPSLRPIFDRLRRQQAPAAQQAQAVIVPPPNETAPVKKSLFGGLFNRG